MFGDIEFDELHSFGIQFDLPIAIAFTQDRQCCFLRIKIIEIKCCDLTGSGAGVIEQMQDGVISEALILGNVYGLEDFEGLFGR